MLAYKVCLLLYSCLCFLDTEEETEALGCENPVP